MKWVILIAGVFLFFNGMFTRTFSFENETPVRHCYYMDYIGLNGCFGSPMVPTLIAWGATLIGAGLIAWSVFRGRQKSA
ncbi:hypothetical protein IG197_01775 [Aminobacter sp. SR38]|jgi:hypothetical protein|uniref:hypothetical protein n=1 Tax=Aminobacter sp. SR38 TaxID=2774562 RepID=UPI00177D6C5A|nr:hypothetical protein [Aminobacter sp. SR38]QOF71846.1 hypothetical protein IG197_01775 [Aminobacter sp. SR38]